VIPHIEWRCFPHGIGVSRSRREARGQLLRELAELGDEARDRALERFRVLLARDDRTDRGRRRAISPVLSDFVEGLALARPLLPISAIHREAGKLAAALGVGRRMRRTRYGRPTML
jgi:hypothetical protein